MHLLPSRHAVDCLLCYFHFSATFHSSDLHIFSSPVQRYVSEQKAISKRVVVFFFPTAIYDL